LILLLFDLSAISFDLSIFFRQKYPDQLSSWKR